MRKTIEVKELADNTLPKILDCYRTATNGMADMMPPYVTTKVITEVTGHLWGIHAFQVDTGIIYVTDPNEPLRSPYFSDRDGYPQS